MTDFETWWASKVFRGMPIKEIVFEAWKAALLLRGKK